MTPAHYPDVLRYARAIIADRERWTKHAIARNQYGGACETERGVKFCAVGAIKATTAQHGGPLAVLNEAAINLYGRISWEVNDNLGHVEVMRVYDEAIRLAEKANA